MKNPVNRLLRRNVSAGQTAGYALANLAGLVIALVALQFYRDATSGADSGESYLSSDYLIISKRVEGVQGMGAILPGGSESASFSAAETGEIASQEWAAATGAFTSADFNVSARIDMAGASMSTALFLESIPDEFFDVSPRGWEYEPGRSKTLPIIISKDYLTLYNFGFAASRGLPQLSEELISMIPIRLSISGNGRQEWIDARIAGFSSRLNTIAVPTSFMEHANSVYGESSRHDPSRLIVKLRKAGDPKAMEFMRTHGYEIAGDKDVSGRAGYFLAIVTAVVVSVGLVICILACFILMLSIHLLLQKNRTKIHDLMMLGYTPSQVSASYIRIILTVNSLVLAAAIAGMTAASMAWRQQLHAIGAEGASLLPTIVIGIIAMAVVSAGNVAVVKNNVRKAFRLQL